jgi:hypothetical protein
MSTIDYFAQPGSVSSDLGLLATDLLLILDHGPAQEAPPRLLSRKQGVFNQGKKFFSLAYNGSFMSPCGIHSVAFLESIKAYGELVACVGHEAKNKIYLGQIGDHSKTLEILASGNQPSEEKLNNLKDCLRGIKTKSSEKKNVSQSDVETILQNLSYISP